MSQVVPQPHEGVVGVFAGDDLENMAFVAPAAALFTLAYFVAQNRFVRHRGPGQVHVAVAGRGPKVGRRNRRGRRRRCRRLGRRRIRRIRRTVPGQPDGVNRVLEGVPGRQ